MIVKDITIGDCRLILGDCAEVMPGLDEFDAAVFDPPYGAKMDKGANTGGTDGSGKYIRRPRKYKGGWDSERADPKTILLALSMSKIGIIWGGNFMHEFLPLGKKWLAWDKKNSMPTYSDCELAWTGLGGDSVKMFSQCASGLAANRDGRFHPTQKPVALMKWCLSFVPDAHTILDPFAGSGTTLVACAQMGKAGTGIERDPDYFEIACERVRKAYEQPDFFVEPPKGIEQEAFDILGVDQ